MVVVVVVIPPVLNLVKKSIAFHNGHSGLSGQVVLLLAELVLDRKIVHVWGRNVKVSG